MRNLPPLPTPPLSAGIGGFNAAAEASMVQPMKRLTTLSRRTLLRLAAAVAIIPGAARLWPQPDAPVRLTFAVAPASSAQEPDKGS